MSSLRRIRPPEGLGVGDWRLAIGIEGRQISVRSTAPRLVAALP
jgi:hypothetical protein